MRKPPLTEILYDVISEWVLDESKYMHRDLADQLNLLNTRSMINAALKNATAMAVSSNNNTVRAHGVKDELGQVSHRR